MNKLTDLEICKRLAEIEGLEFIVKMDVFGFSECVFADSENHAGLIRYNPLTDDALCFNLMIKYGIRYDGRKIKGRHHFWSGNIKNKNYTITLHPNRAICLAIIASKV